MRSEAGCSRGVEGRSLFVVLTVVEEVGGVDKAVGLRSFLGRARDM